MAVIKIFSILLSEKGFNFSRVVFSLRISSLEDSQVSRLSKVRLRLSGALMFAANLVGYLTGFIFTIFITRRLSEEEFGVWALIGSFIMYSLMPFNLVSSWISRDAARGKKVLFSAAVLFALLTPVSLIIYFVIAIGSATAVNYDPWTLILGVIILIPYILLTLGMAIQSGYAPQTIGIAGIFFEVSKVIMAFYLVVILRMGLIGAFITLSIAYLIQATLLLQRSKLLFQKQVNKELIAKWLRGTPISTVRIVNDVLAGTDIVLMSIVTGQAIVAGYWQAAVAASALVTSSTALMAGLSPRLISGGSQKDLDKVFDFTMMLMIPMLFGFMVLSGDILWVMRPAYSSVWIAACFLALAGIIRIFGNFGEATVSGMDKFDQRDEVTMKEFLKSRIFTLNILNLVITVIYVISITFYLLVFRGLSLAEIVIGIAEINLLFAVIRSAINLNLMRSFTKLRLNLRNLPHYLIASTLMITVIYIVRAKIGRLPAGAIEATSWILVLITTGALTYGVTLYILSKDFRIFLKEVKSFIANMSLSL